MGLLLQQLGSQRLLNHLFMVEFVEAIPNEIIRLANTNAGQDNNIIFSKKEFQGINRRVIGKRKVQELWDLRNH